MEKLPESQRTRRVEEVQIPDAFEEEVTEKLSAIFEKRDMMQQSVSSPNIVVSPLDVAENNNEPPPHFQEGKINGPLFKCLNKQYKLCPEDFDMVAHIQDSSPFVNEHLDDDQRQSEEDSIMRQNSSSCQNQPLQLREVTEEDGDETDIEIWAGTSRSVKKRAKDEKCSEVLIQVVKENYKTILNGKIRREIVFGKIAEEVRKRGVRITRKKTAWKLVYNKWRKLKESFDTYVTPPTGEEAKPKPPLYDELHEILGRI